MNGKPTYKPIRAIGPYDGVILVDKPAGLTSHDVVAKIRRRFRFDKVGHGGTLDPMATGLLVILVERGTKLSDRFLTSDKTYEGTMLLGVSTDSHDIEGKVLRQAPCDSVTRESVEQEMNKLTGDLMQTPPMVSAAKKNGVALYKLARRGKTVERKPKLIHIFKFQMLDFSLPSVSFVLKCTKGTYVRTLCSDIGDNLGCGACLEQLRRTESGAMRVGDAASLAGIMEMNQDQLLKLIIPLHKFAAGA